MKNLISRRSFLLPPVSWVRLCAGCLRWFFQQLGCSFQQCSCFFRQCSCFLHQHQAVDIPHRRLGQG